MTNVKTVRTTTGAGDYNITPLIPGILHRLRDS